MLVSELRFNTIIYQADIIKELGVDPEKFDYRRHKFYETYGDRIVGMARKYIETHKKYMKIVKILKLKFNECDNIDIVDDWDVFVGLYYTVDYEVSHENEER